MVFLLDEDRFVRGIDESQVSTDGMKNVGLGPCM